MSDRTFTKYGEKKAGTNNKFYQVTAEEQEDGSATWEFRWGRIGSVGQTKSGRSYSFESAKTRCTQQFCAKQERGYREVTAMEALASAAEDPEERPNEGLPPVEVEIPCFHAGKSEKRLQEFCAKYLKKLNVIRASRNKLGWKESERQSTALLKQYCAEFKRMKSTKAHGHLADNASAHTAFRIFFGDLWDNAGIYVSGYFEGIGVR